MTSECAEPLALQIAATLREYGVPGASIAVSRGTEIVWGVPSAEEVKGFRSLNIMSV